MRKLLRSIARAKMLQAGLEHINDKPIIINKGKMGGKVSYSRGRSIFALKWREYAAMPTEKVEKQQKKNQKKRKFAK